jgi:NAD(P)-dependent dehydrogenase (short-subunit alcohol dehydrogenase family)
VVVADIKEAQASDLARRLDPSGDRLLPVKVDVADYDSVEAMTAKATRWAGGVDVLVNNAGIGEPMSPVWEMPLSDWDRTIGIDLTGVFYCTRSVLPVMLERGWGRVVNIASIAGKEGKHNPAAYAAAKAGVIGLTKSVAFEVAARGILVNAITPGSINSQNWAKLSEEQIEAYRARHPVGRIGEPEEVAALVAWLSSDECSFSTGAVFDISGGRAGH